MQGLLVSLATGLGPTGKTWGPGSPTNHTPPFGAAPLVPTSPFAPVPPLGHFRALSLTVSNWKKNITKLHKEAKKQAKKAPGKTTNLY